MQYFAQLADGLVLLAFLGILCRYTVAVGTAVKSRVVLGQLHRASHSIGGELGCTGNFPSVEGATLRFRQIGIEESDNVRMSAIEGHIPGISPV